MNALMGYITARKMFDGWCLFYRGTRNEVFPACTRFATAQAARKAYKDQVEETHKLNQRFIEETITKLTTY